MFRSGTDLRTDQTGTDQAVRSQGWSEGSESGVQRRVYGGIVYPEGSGGIGLPWVVRLEEGIVNHRGLDC